MLSILFFGVALALIGACVFLPSRQGFVVLVVSLFFVPGHFVVPNPATSETSVHRLELLGILLRLIFEYRAREHDRRIFRLTPVHVAFAVFLVVELLCGVLNDAGSVAVGLQVSTMLNLIFLAVLFVTTLAVLRSNAAFDLLRPLALGLLISTGIAVIEKITKASFAHAVFSAFPGQQSTVGSATKPLEHRAGTVRVRAAAEFALQFAWVTAAILPILFIERLERAKRMTIDVLPYVTVVLAVIYWSQTRSVASGLGVALLGLWILCRDRQVSGLVTLGFLAAGIGVLLIPSLVGHFSSQVNEGSILVRSLRLKQLLQIASDHPLAGLGFHAGDNNGLATTDADLAHVYFETGLLGVTVFIGLLVSAVLAAVRVFRIEDLRDRRRGAALATGALVLAASSTSLDSFALVQTSWLFWICVAGAIAISERHLGQIQMPRMIGYWRFALPVIGLAIGSLLYLADSPHAGIREDVFLLGVINEHDPDPVNLGTWMLDAVCEIAQTTPHPPGTHLECRDPHKVSGVGEIEITAKSSAAAQILADRIHERATTLSRYPNLRFLPTEIVNSSKDSYAKGAPAVGALTGLFIALTWPAGGPLQRRRRRALLERRSRRFARQRAQDAAAQPVLS